MNYIPKLCLSAAVVIVCACRADADPNLEVSYEGVNGNGNHTWAVRIGPDPELFTDTTSGFGSSLATELAFAVRGSELVSFSKDAFNWDFDNPGNNPFTDSATFGTWVSDDNTLIFSALGGRVFTDAGPFDTLFFETLGSDETVIDYGIAASGEDERGTLIAQSGEVFQALSAPLSSLSALNLAAGTAGSELIQFYGYTGSVSSIPEPSAFLLIIGAAVAFAAATRRPR